MNISRRPRAASQIPSSRSFRRARTALCPKHSTNALCDSNPIVGWRTAWLRRISGARAVLKRIPNSYRLTPHSKNFCNWRRRHRPDYQKTQSMHVVMSSYDRKEREQTATSQMEWNPCFVRRGEVSYKSISMRELNAIPIRYFVWVRKSPDRFFVPSLKKLCRPC